MIRPILLTDIAVTPPRGLNKALYLDINNFAKETAFAHSFMHVYALWLGLALLSAIFVALYIKYWFDKISEVTIGLFTCGALTLVALLVNQFVGKAVREKRPYNTFQHALVLVGKTSDYSFPSDHSVVAGALLTSILIALYAGKKTLSSATYTQTSGTRIKRSLITTLAVFLALFLCFARVYVGVHYPGDVIAGLLEGTAIAGLLSYLRYPLHAILSKKALSFLKIFFAKPTGHTLAA